MIQQIAIPDFDHTGVKHSLPFLDDKHSKDQVPATAWRPDGSASRELREQISKQVNAMMPKDCLKDLNDMRERNEQRQYSALDIMDCNF